MNSVAAPNDQKTSAKLCFMMLRLYLFPLPTGVKSPVRESYRAALEVFPGMWKQEVFRLMAGSMTRAELAKESKRQGSGDFAGLVEEFFKRELPQFMAEEFQNWRTA